MKRHVIGIITSAFLLAGCESSSDPQVRAHEHEFGCIAGTVGGAIVGGLIGSTIGHGRGAVLGTAIGLGGGGYLGNRLACQ